MSSIEKTSSHLINIVQADLKKEVDWHNFEQAYLKRNMQWVEEEEVELTQNDLALEILETGPYQIDEDTSPEDAILLGAHLMGEDLHLFNQE